MHRPLRSAFGPLALGVAAFLPFSAHAQTGERIPSYHVDLRLAADGAMAVEETVRYDFGANDRHGILRDISTKTAYAGIDRRQFQSIRIEDVSVTRDGKPEPFDASTSGGVRSLKIGDADATITGTHEYRIRYTVRRATGHYDAFDELYWNAIGPGWKVPIDRASATLHLPPELAALPDRLACYTGPAGATEPCSVQRSADGTRVTASVKDGLEPYEAVTIGVGVPAGVLPAPKIVTIGSDLFFQGLTLGTIVAFLAWAAGYYLWRYRPAFEQRFRPTVAQFDVPTLVSPSQAALVQEGNGPTALHRGPVGDLIELARLGFATITSTTKTGFFGGKKTSFEISFPRPNEEPPAELGTLRDLLKATGNPTTLEKIQQKHLGPKLQRYIQDQAERLAQEHADVARSAPRFLAGPGARSWIACAWPFLALAPALLVFPFQGETISISGTEAEYALPLTAVVVLIAIVDSLVAATALRYALNVRLDLQNDLFQHLDGLKLYLGVAEKDRLAFHNAPEKNPQLFEKLLPYAIALGVEEAWAEAFKDILSQPPDWYRGSDTFSASAFASSMHTFSASAAASVASFPQSSGTGSSGSGGGGSSGGGGGGGGGGSW